MYRKIIGMLLCVFVFLPNVYAKKDTIKIGLTLGLSGKYEAMTPMYRDSYLLWEDHINAKGGLLGKKVKIIIRDDQSSKVVAKEIYTHFIESKEVDFIIGPYSSSITGAVMPVCEKNKYPVVAAGAASDKLWDLGYKYLFGIYATAKRYTVGFLEMVAMEGITDIAIVGADDSFSMSASSGTKEWAERFGLKVVMYETFKKDSHELEELAKKVAKSKVKTLVVTGHYHESVDMIKAFKKIGWKPDNYFATIGPALDKFNDELAEDAENVFSAVQWAPGVRFQSGDDVLYESFKAKYKKVPSYHAAEAYAACQILSSAIIKANSIDQQEVRDVLAVMDTTSVLGRYGVDQRGKQIKHYPLTVQWQGGKKEVVWPKKIASKKAVIIK